MLLIVLLVNLAGRLKAAKEREPEQSTHYNTIIDSLLLLALLRSLPSMLLIVLLVNLAGRLKEAK